MSQDIGGTSHVAASATSPSFVDGPTTATAAGGELDA
jgi:hypothetical protein